MKQKFKRSSFVKVKTDHHEGNGIIDCSYSQIYGGKNIKEYSIYVIENDNIINRLSWIDEEEIALCENQNQEKAETMIENYNLKGTQGW